MKPFLYSEHLSISGFYEILKLILFNNIFSFSNKYFKQIKGIAMGTICGPTIANLYLSNLEKYWLTITKPIFYVRFIDDIFVILLHELDKLHLESFFINLKINVCSGKSVNFLDLVISIDKLCNTLNFSLFIKKTNTFQYLLSNSNHPYSIIKNMPKGIKGFQKGHPVSEELKEYHRKRLLGKPGHKIYNLGSGRGYSVREVIEAANRATGKATPFVDAEKRSGDPAILIADITKVKRELGWAPIRGINEMVADAESATVRCSS
jgi:hypothetical protein